MQPLPATPLRNNIATYAVCALLVAMLLSFGSASAGSSRQSLRQF